jgi:pyrimidine-nucleoside phosphorylase
MSVYFNGMNNEETSFLLKAMLESGESILANFFNGKAVDKHSTGGVGDKLSLILAPIVASYAVPVPMIAGRGLGHTGGTLDKLESIKGFNINLNFERFKKQVKTNYLAIIGQTKEIAPADKKIYALRDITGTVPSIPLITASILSKKLAEGISSLVMDVKCGYGAFMKDEATAEKLALSISGAAKAAGVNVSVFLTRMDEPLGYKIGNALEIEETLDVLDNKGPEDVTSLSLYLAAEMLVLASKANTFKEGFDLAKKSLENGSAKEKFYEMVKLQGGSLSDWKNNRMPYQNDDFLLIKASHDGYLQKLDAYLLGMASIEAGAGRQNLNDNIDFSAGIILEKKVGDYVKKNDCIMKVYFKKLANKEAVTQKIYEAIEINNHKVKNKEAILKVIHHDKTYAFSDYLSL